MELRHLKYFVAVSELGSVSRAAEKLFIAQPPLSVQIKQLEEEVGTPLLLRHPRGVKLTPAGAAFLAEAKDVLARADHAKRVARQVNNSEGGVVRIGFVPTASHTVIPRLVRRLRTARPQIEIEVREMISGEQVEALLPNEIDVGLLRPPIASGPVLIASSLQDPFCLAVPEGHALAGEDPIQLRAAARVAFVSVTRHRGPVYFDQTIGLCTDAGFNPDIRYEASTIYGVLELVGAGLGVGLVPASAITVAPRGLTFRLLRRPSRTGSLALAHLRDDPNPIVAILAVLDERSLRGIEERSQGPNRWVTLTRAAAPIQDGDDLAVAWHRRNREPRTRRALQGR